MISAWGYRNLIVAFVLVLYWVSGIVMGIVLGFTGQLFMENLVAIHGKLSPSTGTAIHGNLNPSKMWCIESPYASIIIYGLKPAHEPITQFGW